MRHMKTISVPATTKQVEDYTTCDICGQKIKNTGYELDEVTIRLTKGESYPEGSWGEHTEVDMCSDCFTEKLLPWLSSHGATPRTIEFG